MSRVSRASVHEGSQRARRSSIRQSVIESGNAWRRSFSGGRFVNRLARISSSHQFPDHVADKFGSEDTDGSSQASGFRRLSFAFGARKTSSRASKASGRASKLSISSKASFVAAPLRAWFRDSTETWFMWFFGHSQSEEASMRRLGNKGSDDARVKRIITELRALRSRRTNWRADEDVATMLRDSSVPWSFFDIFEQDVGDRNLQTLRQIRPFSRFASFTRAAVTAIGAFSIVYTTLLISYWDVFVSDEVVGRGTVVWRLLQVVDVLCDLIYLVATLSRLVTGIVDVSSGVEICLPERVLWKVLNSGLFWTDVLTCFPWTLMATAASSWFPRQLALVKVLRSGHLFERPCSWLVFQQDLSWVVYLLLSVVWMGGHLLSCVYFVLILSEFFAQGEIQPKWSFLESYFFCYRTCVYLLLGEDLQHIEIDEGIQHKDLLYLGYAQNLFLVIGMPVGFLISALVFSQIIVVVQQRSALETLHIERENELRQTMASYDLPASLQLRLLAYYSYEKIHQAHVTFEKIFSNLSPQLNFELRFFLFYEQVTKVHLFEDCQPRVLRELVLNLNDKLFLPGDYVCRFGDKGEEMFFICKGRCSVLTQDMVTLVLQLGPGEHFGEIAVIMGQRRNAYVRADGFVLTASLTKDNFEDIMKEFPEELRVIMSKMSAQQLQQIQSMGRTSTATVATTSVGIRSSMAGDTATSLPQCAGGVACSSLSSEADVESTPMAGGRVPTAFSFGDPVCAPLSRVGELWASNDSDCAGGAAKEAEVEAEGNCATSNDTVEARAAAAAADSATIAGVADAGAAVPSSSAGALTIGASLGALARSPSLPSSARHSRASSPCYSPGSGARAAADNSPVDRQSSGFSCSTSRKDFVAAVGEIRASAYNKAGEDAGIAASNSSGNILEVMGQPAASSQRSASGQMPSASGSRSSSSRTSECVLGSYHSTGSRGIHGASMASGSGGGAGAATGSSDAGNRMAWGDASETGQRSQEGSERHTPTFCKEEEEDEVEPAAAPSACAVVITPSQKATSPASPGPDSAGSSLAVTMMYWEAPTGQERQESLPQDSVEEDDDSDGETSSVLKEAPPVHISRKQSKMSKLFGFIPVPSGSNRSSITVAPVPAPTVPERKQSPSSSSTGPKGWRASITTSINMLRVVGRDGHSSEDGSAPPASSNALVPKPRSSKVGGFLLGTAAKFKPTPAAAELPCASAAAAPGASCSSASGQGQSGEERVPARESVVSERSERPVANSKSPSSSKPHSRCGSRKSSRSPSAATSAGNAADNKGAIAAAAAAAHSNVRSGSYHSGASGASSAFGSGFSNPSELLNVEHAESAKEGDSCPVEELSPDGDAKHGFYDSDSDDSSVMTSKPRWMAARKIYKANKDRIDSIKKEVEAGTRQPPKSMGIELRQLSKTLDELVSVQLQVKKAIAGLESSCSHIEKDLPQVSMLWEEQQTLLQRDGDIFQGCLDELKSCIEAASVEVENAFEDAYQGNEPEIDLAAEAVNIVNEHVDNQVELRRASTPGVHRLEDASRQYQFSSGDTSKDLLVPGTFTSDPLPEFAPAGFRKASFRSGVEHEDLVL